MENDGTNPATQVQNVQENIPHEQSIPSVDHMSADHETSGYVKRHSYHKAGKTKKKRKLLMIELLQKVMPIYAWISPFKLERVFRERETCSLHLKVREVFPKGTHLFEL